MESRSVTGNREKKGKKQLWAKPEKLKEDFPHSFNIGTFGKMAFFFDVILLLVHLIRKGKWVFSFSNGKR